MIPAVVERAIAEHDSSGYIGRVTFEVCRCPDCNARRTPPGEARRADELRGRARMLARSARGGRAVRK